MLLRCGRRDCQRIVKQKLHVPTPTVSHKRCACCDVTKAAAEFHRNWRNKSGLGSYCKVCLTMTAGLHKSFP